MRRIVLLLAVIALAGCSPRKAVKEEVAPLIERADQLGQKIEKIERQLTKLPQPSGAAVTPSPVPTKAEQPAESPEEKLYGTWISDKVESPLGPIKNRVTFHKEGEVSICTWSVLPFLEGKELRTTKGPFKVEGDTITSNSIEGGTKVQYHFEGDDLVIRYGNGKTVRLHRA